MSWQVALLSRGFVIDTAEKADLMTCDKLPQLASPIRKLPQVCNELSKAWPSPKHLRCLFYAGIYGIAACPYTDASPQGQVKLSAFFSAAPMSSA